MAPLLVHNSSTTELKDAKIAQMLDKEKKSKFFLFFFFDNRIRMQEFIFARQILYHLSYHKELYCFS
jgi:hypothetical protein